MKIQEAPLFKKILVVDDDEASACLSTTVLSDMHAAKDIEVAQDGYIASQLIDESNCPDIIFLDIHMPKMDGFGFLEHLRKIGLSMKTKIIMLSSSCSKEDRDKALSYKNVLAFVQKPLTEDIIRKIRAAYC